MAYGLPSRQTVNVVGGCKRARDVAVGARLWTLDGTGSVQTAVEGVAAVKAREVVEVLTGHVVFTVAPGQLLRTADGWVHAADAVGKAILWTQARKLCRERPTIQPGYEFGYFVGATCADGTVGKNYVSLVVNDKRFAARYAASLTAATGLVARLEPVTRPSGYLQRDVPGYRVRVVSSYLADLMRQFVGGDAHHMRQRFPRVVLRHMDDFEGFLDGYVDGDGFRLKGWTARAVISGNVPFLAELAQVIGARFTPKADGAASHLVIADSWPLRGTYQQEEHPLELCESGWMQVREVRPCTALGTKPYTCTASNSPYIPRFW
ncbi:hypothetical protein [Streptomyces sp. NBC_00212]|uniref:hypothetical protein n=1 Tax=Streptomyces sp. NBC_00212 TaxID=2975684 RepID=UPI003244913D